jgi:hypothetical protein
MTMDSRLLYHLSYPGVVPRVYEKNDAAARCLMGTCRAFGRNELQLGECSGMTPEPTAQDETANNSDDSSANGIEGDHGGQQKCQDDQGCTALSVAVSPSEHNRRAADEKCSGEEHSAGLREPKPVTERSPIASESSHA